MKKILSLAVAAVVSLGAVGTASAATATGTISPTATVNAACVINSANMDFGTVSGVVKSNVDVAGTINMDCTGNLAYTITGNKGQSSPLAKVAGRRVMKASGSTTGLDYDLFTSTARTTVLGDTSAAGIAGTSGAPGGATAVPIFGRIYTGQTYAGPIGVVSDTVALTVTF